MSKPIFLSVIIPFYNENGNLPQLHRELVSVLKDQQFKSEIIYVDDGSQDNSAFVLATEAKGLNNPSLPVKLIRLRRNSGQTSALSAGINHAQGNVLAFLDADLQNSPADLPRMLEVLDKDTDVVFGWRKNREDAKDRVFISKFANFAIRTLFHINLRDLGCAIKIVRKEILTDFHLYGETHRILGVLLILRGAKYKEIIVAHSRRLHEKSKYGYTRFFKLIIDLITTKFLNSYSSKPAYVFGTGGIICNLLGFLALVLVIYRKFFLGVFVHRDPIFLIAIFLLLIGFQFILMGLLAELVVRVYFEARQKPTYDIKEVTIL